MPPVNWVSVDTTTCAANCPGIAASEGSLARGLIALNPTLFRAASRLNPKRAELVTDELKMWVSSRIPI